MGARWPSESRGNARDGHVKSWVIALCNWEMKKSMEKLWRQDFVLPTYPLTCALNLAITKQSHWTSLGVLFRWRKSGCKKVNPSKMLCVALSAKCSRKILLRRLSATPFI